jgi:hypothetical protein
MDNAELAQLAPLVRKFVLLVIVIAIQFVKLDVAPIALIVIMVFAIDVVLVIMLVAGNAELVPVAMMVIMYLVHVELVLIPFVQDATKTIAKPVIILAVLTVSRAII